MVAIEIYGFKDFYRAAKQFFNQGDYSQAMENYRRALALAVSDFAKGHCLWGLAECRGAYARIWREHWPRFL